MVWLDRLVSILSFGTTTEFDTCNEPFMYLVILSVQPYKTLPATTYICVTEHLHVCHSLPKDGWTPFHAACHEGHAQVAEMLLQAGASVELETEVRWDQIVLGGKN